MSLRDSLGWLKLDLILLNLLNFHVRFIVALNLAVAEIIPALYNFVFIKRRIRLALSERHITAV